MSTHIAAKPGEIAGTILLPGDPLRAQFIAETYLENPRQYTAVRNIFGYTGTYRGKPLSVQGTGMGIPSISIYIHELFRDYGVQRAVRIGTAGAVQESLKLRDIVLAMSASTDSAVNLRRFGGRSYAPAASWGLLKTAWDMAVSKGWTPAVGNVVCSDLFYGDDGEEWKLWARYGALALEMESAELYTVAAKFKREALAILTISDHLVTGEQTTSEERQSAFTRMMELALETAVSPACPSVSP
ncbi:MAG: purine-nucleoside phosphorylase [Treponema sp.]|jgi:purine-nucleoside phosphorylase|nr:purine-nucleoside phosphorylase [Treponema sp.]